MSDRSMAAEATAYDGDLKVYTNDEEWVIAHSAEDARAVRDEQGGEPYDDEEWTECSPERVFWLHDPDNGVPQAKTYAEWAKRGRGYLASANY